MKLGVFRAKPQGLVINISVQEDTEPIVETFHASSLKQGGKGWPWDLYGISLDGTHETAGIFRISQGSNDLFSLSIEGYN